MQAVTVRSGLTLSGWRAPGGGRAKWSARTAFGSTMRTSGSLQNRRPGVRVPPPLLLISSAHGFDSFTVRNRYRPLPPADGCRAGGARRRRRGSITSDATGGLPRQGVRRVWRALVRALRGARSPLRATRRPFDGGLWRPRVIRLSARRRAPAVRPPWRSHLEGSAGSARGGVQTSPGRSSIASGSPASRSAHNCTQATLFR